jgi:hypothetical protein
MMAILNGEEGEIVDLVKPNLSRSAIFLFIYAFTTIEKPSCQLTISQQPWLYSSQESVVVLINPILEFCLPVICNCDILCIILSMFYLG